MKITWVERVVYSPVLFVKVVPDIERPEHRDKTETVFV
jgi:hypothetical protein